MAEIGIAYSFLAPDGTRAVIGNCDAAVSDPDFVGYLDGDNGVTGLFDTADVRAGVQELIGEDGALDGPSWLGARSGTFQGLYLPNGTIAQIVRAETKLKAATRALRADGILRWTPSGDLIERMLRFRRNGRVATTGRRPKSFQLPLSSRDAYILSASEANVDLDPANAAAELGIPNPIPDPIVSPLDVAAQVFAVNLGNAPTWPRFRILGPMTNPTLLNNTTGEQLRIIYTLNSGDFLDVYPEQGAIILNGTDNRFSALDFAGSTWWRLQPGSNDVRVLPIAYSAGALVTVFWRHAWE